MMMAGELPAILDLPGCVVSEVCGLLDLSVEHNWKRLVEHVPDYTHMDVMELSNLAQQGQSASRELLINLNGQGWTILELAQAAREAGILSVVQVLSTYCADEGIEVDLLHGPAPRPSPVGSWLAAKSCFHRSTYTTELAPPTSCMEEAYRRYRMPCPPPEPHPSLSTADETSSSSQTSDSTSQSSCITEESVSSTSNSQLTKPSTSRYNSTSSSSIEVPVGLEEVGYEVLLEATDQFDQTPYKEGGHKVGEGGFGEVFQCSLVLQRGRVHAAVKVLLNQTDACGSETSTGSVDSVDRQQFSTETQALSRLSHECLLPILAYSCNGPRLCLIYPFMSNGSLEAHLSDQTTLPPPRRLRVACDVASALHYLHSMPEGVVVHRDVKSANILLSRDWRGKLGDFGLARALPAPSSSHQLTSLLTATIVGTHVYMAPETRGGTITPAADVYAFGVVLYELLTGKCAVSKLRTESGEDTDLLSYLEEYEGERCDLLVGGAHVWGQDMQEDLWILADQCLLKRKKRPTSSKVFCQLETMCS